MKGLLKGLRYISQIFDAKEPEIQIGAPTDVKHVAHIGWDSASVTNPTWMNEFKAQPGASGSGGPEGAGAEQPGGAGGAGAGKVEQSEKPRRTRGKGSGGGEGKRRDADGSRRPAKGEAADGCEGEASGAAATKQRRRKPKASGGTSSGRSKSSSGGARSSEPATAVAED
ncbi:hypothetical protein ACQ4PT_004861 [Festuca glaucescens]